MMKKTSGCRGWVLPAASVGRTGEGTVEEGLHGQRR